MSARKQCFTCNKSRGIMTCDGCERIFCGKHVVEHRQELNKQLDEIMQEHDLLQQELSRSSHQHVLLQKINQWEKESITKIQIVAETARTNVQEMFDKSQKQILKACHDISVNLRSSGEADDFSENNLKQWIQQLKELKFEITSPSSIELIEDETVPFHFITVNQKIPMKKDFLLNGNNSSIRDRSNFPNQERFSKGFGPVEIKDEGLLAVHTGVMFRIAHVLGQQLYTQGQHTVRFKIENNNAASTYNIFLGCISSKAHENEIRYNSAYVLGWFGYNQVWEHGSVNKQREVHGYNSNEIATNDILHLIFNCEQRQIELFHERTKKRQKLSVDLDKAPFPWQILIGLNYANDCVRILS